MVAMLGFFAALVCSVWYLAAGDFRADSLAASIVEVSVVFATVNLVTGRLGPGRVGHLVDVGLPPDLATGLHFDLCGLLNHAAGDR